MSKHKLIYAKALLLLFYSGTSWAADVIYERIPSNFVACAMDNQSCRITQGQSSDIYWGAKAKFLKFENKTGTVTCSAAGLGTTTDPISGTVKTCYVALSAASSPGGTGEILDARPSEYPLCAAEGKTCDVSGEWNGYYGADTSYANIKGIGPFTCSLSVFHIADPANGKSKNCYVESANEAATATGSKVSTFPMANFKSCAVDGELCNVEGSWTGYYGAKSSYVPIAGNGLFLCMPDTFGIDDPLKGVQKTCYVNNGANAQPAPTPEKLPSVPAGYTPCAKDGEICAVTGNWQGVYGANTTYITIAGTDSFTCLPSNLRVADPLKNVTKTCYVKFDTSNSRAVATGITLTAVPSGFDKCAQDFNTCPVTGDWTGYYGQGIVFKQIEGSGPFVCLPETFEIPDPVPNKQKHCYTKAATQINTGFDCSYTRLNGIEATSSVVSKRQCSCRCYTNSAKSNTCYFNQNDLIPSPVCNPGDLP